MDQNLAIPPADRRIVAAGVARVLAETAVLWMKTRGFAWNTESVEGAALAPLLALQARDLQDALAPLADRIRALGFDAPGAFVDLLALSSVGEERGVPAPRAMARQLAADHAQVTALIRCIRPAIEDVEDMATCLVLDRRLCAHEAAAATLAAFARECPPEGVRAGTVLDALVLPDADAEGGESPNESSSS